MKVLIAEDSATPRLILLQALERLGHQCLVAADGVEAWELFRQSEVDLVISDWMMPRMDGNELCRKVRSEPSPGYPYFVMLTSLEDRERIVEAMEAGVDDYLTKPFDREELQARLLAAERVTALHRRLAAQQAELERLNAALHADARRDHLTGLGNRMRLDEDLAAMAAAAERYGHQFSVALFDVDRFKAYNDNFGHLAGDELLRSIASVMVGHSRRDDTVYRYGGEELLVTFAEQNLEAARVAAERMRAAVEAMPRPQVGGSLPRLVTISAGVAEFKPDDAREPSRLLGRADEALYQAKQRGRNRVVVSSTTSAATEVPSDPPDPGHAVSAA